MVVEKALSEFSSTFHLEDLGNKLNGWKHFGNENFHFGSHCIRTNSVIDRCHGFFVAKFERLKSSDKKKRKRRIKNEEIDEPSNKILKR